MKKAIIYFFSGTGNTKVVAEEIKNALHSMDVSTDLYDIRVPFIDVPDPNMYDYVGFGYPIHAFNTPQFFLKFVKKLPAGKNLPVFIFKTSGEPFGFNNASSWSLTRVLKKKGFVPLLDEHLLMPYNIMFRYPPVIVKHMMTHNLKLAQVIARKIVKQESFLPRYYPWTILFMYLARLQWLGAKINGPLIHVNQKKCTACGLCIKRCPAKNIRFVKGYPKFDHVCTMCMSCATICPADAVRPGILNGWRVNGGYEFKKCLLDESIPDITVDDDTKGYFKLFKNYYKKSNAVIDQWRDDEK